MTTTGKHHSEVALVTGGNKGIGCEIVRRLAAEGMTVFLGARDEQRGRAAARELAGSGGEVRFVQLDVTDEAQIDAAVKRIDDEAGRLDVLVNNAGIAVERGVAVPDVTGELMRRTFEVNVFGVVNTMRACLPLLRRSTAARVVNLTSPLGSMTLLSDPENPISGVGLLAYSSSKAALNAATVLYANALRADGVRFTVVSPGYVATDLNGHLGELTVAEGADVPVLVALDRDAGATGRFLAHPSGTFVTPGSDEPVTLPW